jgi:hypothetical protein
MLYIRCSGSISLQHALNSITCTDGYDAEANVLQSFAVEHETATMVKCQLDSTEEPMRWGGCRGPLVQTYSKTKAGRGQFL